MLLLNAGSESSVFAFLSFLVCKYPRAFPALPDCARFSFCLQKSLGLRLSDFCSL